MLLSCRIIISPPPQALTVLWRRRRKRIFRHSTILWNPRKDESLRVKYLCSASRCLFSIPAARDLTADTHSALTGNRAYAMHSSCRNPRRDAIATLDYSITFLHRCLVEIDPSATVSLHQRPAMKIGRTVRSSAYAPECANLTEY